MKERIPKKENKTKLAAYLFIIHAQQQIVERARAVLFSCLIIVLFSSLYETENTHTHTVCLCETIGDNQARKQQATLCI